MNAVVKALGIGMRLMSRIARLPVPLGPAAPLSPTSSKARTRWRALQRMRNHT